MASMINETTVRQSLCEMGQRLYARQFVAGNDGNLSHRLPNQRILCTPTLISKGFMKPQDICLVDLDGHRLSGPRSPTSEILMHLEVYKNDPSTQAVVHCHPPHVTAFAMTDQDVPTMLLPEMEMFLGEVPRASYETPGTAAFAAVLRPYIGRANTVILSNHGVVGWAESLERAMWQVELLDAYCRLLILAKQVGNIRPIPSEKIAELQQQRNRFFEKDTRRD